MAIVLLTTYQKWLHKKWLPPSPNLTPVQITFMDINNLQKVSNQFNSKQKTFPFLFFVEIGSYHILTILRTYPKKQAEKNGWSIERFSMHILFDFEWSVKKHTEHFRALNTYFWIHFNNLFSPISILSWQALPFFMCLWWNPKRKHPSDPRNQIISELDSFHFT